MNPVRDVQPAARTYARLALAFLLVTLGAGVWLRTAPLFPGALGDIAYGNAVHAHSHLALFGWATMGLMGVIAGALGERASPRLRWHAWTIGAASSAAFLAFLWQGYGLVSIVISTLQVVLWAIFARATWSGTAGMARPSGLWTRAALGSLLVAAAASILPGITTATSASHAVQRLAVEVFLTLVIQGWLFLATVAILVAPGVRSRWHAPALAMLLSGMLPAVLMRVPGVESEALMVLGRTGLLLTGAGTLLVAWSVWPRSERASTRDAAILPQHGASTPQRAQAWLRLALACVALKGVSEVIAAAEPARMLVLLRPVVIAYLHLVLLGALTSALVAALVPASRMMVRGAAVHAAGLALTLGALGAIAIPDLLGRPIPLAGRPMLVAVLAGGVLSAVGVGAAACSGLLGNTSRSRVGARESFGASPAPALD